MKFVCDRCKTKYTIADEKVRQKVLKIRCKNCQQIIVVREPAAGEETGVGEAPVAPSPPRALDKAFENTFGAPPKTANAIDRLRPGHVRNSIGNAEETQIAHYPDFREEAT